MPVRREDARRLLDLYVRAWQEQSCRLLSEIFSEDARYYERWYSRDKQFHGLPAIEGYWLDRVVHGQRDIRVDLHNVYCDGDTVIAEWEARFHDIPSGSPKQIREVAILEIGPHGKVVFLREFWDSFAMNSADSAE